MWGSCCRETNVFTFPVVCTQKTLHQWRAYWPECGSSACDSSSWICRTCHSLNRTAGAGYVHSLCAQGDGVSKMNCTKNPNLHFLSELPSSILTWNKCETQNTNTSHRHQILTRYLRSIAPPMLALHTNEWEISCSTSGRMSGKHQHWRGAFPKQISFS